MAEQKPEVMQIGAGMKVAHMDYPGRMGIVVPNNVSVGAEDEVMVQFEAKGKGLPLPHPSRMKIKNLNPFAGRCPNCLFCDKSGACIRYRSEGEKLLSELTEGGDFSHKAVPQAQYPGCREETI